MCERTPIRGTVRSSRPAGALATGTDRRLHRATPHDARRAARGGAWGLSELSERFACRTRVERSANVRARARRRGSRMAIAVMPRGRAGSTVNGSSGRVIRLASARGALRNDGEVAGVQRGLGDLAAVAPISGRRRQGCGQAPVLVPRRDRGRGGVRQALSSRAGRARARPIAARGRRHRVRPWRVAVLQDRQVGDGGRPADSRGDVMTAARLGGRRRKRHRREQEDCPGEGGPGLADGSRGHGIAMGWRNGDFRNRGDCIHGQPGVQVTGRRLGGRAIDSISGSRRSGRPAAYPWPLLPPRRPPVACGGR